MRTTTAASLQTRESDSQLNKNRMQRNDFVQSNMYQRTLLCLDCPQVHSDTLSLLPLAGNKLCLSCHDAPTPSGLRSIVARHTHHS